MGHETEILDFTLVSILGFKKTPKPVLMFNWSETTKRSFTLFVCKEKQEQTFGKIYEILFCAIPMFIPIAQLTFLRSFSA